MDASGRISKGARVNMLFSNAAQVYLATGPIDGRKSFNALGALVTNTLKENPLSGRLFVFYNKKRDLLKLLYWDKNGLCLWQKRLAKGRFVMPREFSVASLELTYCQLKGLTEGIDWQKIEKPKELTYTLM